MLNKLSLSIKGILLLLTIALTGCVKPIPPDTHTNDSNEGTVILHIHTNLDTNEVENYGDIYTLANGRKISASFAQMYLSEFQFKRQDGTWFTVPDSIVLKTLEKEEYVLYTHLPANTYTAVRFKTGFRSIAHPSPDMQYTGDPADGYAFIRFDGKVDTTRAGNGTVYQMQPFTYKLNSDSAFKEITLPDRQVPWKLDKGGVMYAHIIANYAALLNGIDLSKPSNLSVIMPWQMSQEPARSMVKNIPSMFSYEE